MRLNRCFLFCLVCLPLVSASQGNPATIQKIVSEGRDRSQGIATLRELSFRIGGRVTGSPTLDRGVDWAVQKFRTFGITDVKKEQWLVINPGFDRGKRQSASLVAPFRARLPFTTPNWTPGTTGPVRGLAVPMPKSEEELRANRASYKGAWILMPQTTGMRGPDLRQMTSLDRLIDETGISGRVYGTSGQYVWTHGTWNDYTEATRPKTPLIALTQVDFLAVSSLAERGLNPELEFDIENLFFNRPIPQYNVVAELKGTEKPDEYVIICGHIDSWNGPESQGACDNGTGTTATLEAARILHLVGARPKRSIRFILWTGEEQGLLGAAAYVQSRRNEWNKIQAVLNEDSGPSWIASMGGVPEHMPILNEAAKGLESAFPGKPFVPRQVQALSRGGSDHAAFVQVGIPGYFMIKGGAFPYARIWHTQYDRASQVEPQNMAQMSTVMAVMAYNLACSDQMLARVPVPAARYTSPDEDEEELVATIPGYKPRPFAIEMAKIGILLN